jgi:hypothetical protein
VNSLSARYFLRHAKTQKRQAYLRQKKKAPPTPGMLLKKR